jgi:hypothetical protein
VRSQGDSKGFRKVPNWLFFEEIRRKHARGEPLEAIEAWCSLDSDLYRGRLGSDRGYAVLWRRSRGWTQRLTQRFREEHGLSDPARGRRPNQPGGPTPGREPIPDLFLDHTVDRVSDALSMPWKDPGTTAADRATAQSGTTSKRQRLRDV